MKTKSLTPWCRLYYSELNYNIKVSPSKHRAIFNLLFYFGFTYLTLTVLFGISFWLGFFMAALLGFIIFLYRQAPAPLASQWLMLFTSSKDKTKANFVLSDTGECQFNHQKSLQISANSQINLWGYWLVFSSRDAVTAQHFIFKDSLSSKDQARLARTILRVKSYG
ncbi:protein YgfX [Colwellia sp. MB02u-10]|uniref:protein YgfX n=1 Tax=Colwellia sp. MB02u-10 TaxID=2759828 RepID=UPI0028737853|nr:protein YgfX [Colwellia sp. MB02u-10]